MKKYIYIFCFLIVAGFAFNACKPEEEMDPAMGAAPTPDQATFDVTPDPANPNILVLKNTSPGFNAKWDFGNGASGTGNEVKAPYPLKGDYTITMTMYARGGSASSSKAVTIAETNYGMLDRPDLNALSGGGSKPEGKTWVIDKEYGGHMGLGPNTTGTADWWNAGPNEKAGQGLYDDEYTFIITGLKADFKMNGDAFANGASAGDFGGNPANGDQKVTYNPPATINWSLTEEGGKKYIVLSNSAFIGFYTGVSKYEILKLEENELYIRFLDVKNTGFAWYHRLIPKGYVKPKPEIPYKIANMDDTFDAPGNIAWTIDGAGFKEEYDNPRPLGNTSGIVAKYDKNIGGKYNNVQVNLSYKMDLRERNKFRLKVFTPSYNDTATVFPAESWAINHLRDQVSVKLQNSELGGNAYTTQVEVIHRIQVDQLNQWVEFEFDFSSASERKDLDRIVVQLGGEGHDAPGTFFIDDFKLMPKQ
jgi:hypothetical protein